MEQNSSASCANAQNSGIVGGVNSPKQSHATARDRIASQDPMDLPAQRA